MNWIKKLKKLKAETLHIMIIPHSGKNIRQLKLKRYFFMGITFIIVCMTVVSVWLGYSTVRLNHELYKKSEDLSKLKALSLKQSTEIDDLKIQAKEITEKLISLDQLENEVQTLVSSEHSNPLYSIPISRSYFRNKDFLCSEEKNITQTQLKALVSRMDVKTQNLSLLAKKLELYKSTPTLRPTKGSITSPFGSRISPFTHRVEFHKGIDIANKINTPILASAQGIVTFAGWNAGYGKTVILSHGHGYRTLYAHNQTILVKLGQKVQQGDCIAKLGNTGRSTGPHVHFEVHYQGKLINPLTVIKP